MRNYAYNLDYFSCTLALSDFLRTHHQWLRQEARRCTCSCQLADRSPALLACRGRQHCVRRSRPRHRCSQQQQQQLQTPGESETAPAVLHAEPPPAYVRALRRDDNICWNLTRRAGPSRAAEACLLNTTESAERGASVSLGQALLYSVSTGKRVVGAILGK